MRLFTVGVWQTRCVAMGMPEIFKNSPFDCKWAIDGARNPLLEIQRDPVDVIVAYRKIPTFASRVAAILKSHPETRVVATTSSQINKAEAEYLVEELGVNSLVRLPGTEEDESSFFQALTTV